MRKKLILLFCILFVCIDFLSKVATVLASDNVDSGVFEKGSSYYLIHYNSGEQEIVLSEMETLRLTGWKDQSKTAVTGIINDSSSANHSKTLTLQVNNELNKIETDTDTIYYRLVVSDSFKVQEVTPQEFNNKSTVLLENQNGSSIEKTETFDEYGTLINSLGFTYYSVDENNQKTEITKEEYDALSSSANLLADDSALEDTFNDSNGQVNDFSTLNAAPSIEEQPSIQYSTHVQYIGWQQEVADGEMSGTYGQALRLESIRISLKNVQDLGIKYSTHVQDYGWLNDVSDGADSGTTGQSKRLEAIKIELTGSKAANYDIYYRVHVQDYGWMNWVKNGELSGTTGKSKRLEAINILILEKGATPPTNNQSNQAIFVDPSVTYRAYVESNGWLSSVSDGETGGTVGQNKRLEAIQISLNNTSYNGGITYKTHIQNKGWVASVADGATSGTVGEGKRIEAIQMNLTGEMSNHYDVYYRVHSQNKGWLGWAKNGESAGTQGLSLRMEAIEIVIVKKGENPPGTTERPFLSKPSVSYSTHVESIGWLDYVMDGVTSGTEGRAKRVEAIKINIEENLYGGGISYSTKAQDYGWLNNVSNGEVSGTSGEGKKLEAININLTGEIANYYDIYYRTLVQNFGWLGWAKNGENAGSDTLRIEAVQIVLVEKGENAPGSTQKAFITLPSVEYSSYVEGTGWLGNVADGVMSGTEGQGKRMEAIKIDLTDSSFSGDITYSTYIQDYGWLANVSNNEISGFESRNKRLEAIRIGLTGELANYYDVYYRVHVESYGWLGWAKNGMNAGTQDLAKQVEAIEIKLVFKGQGEATSQIAAFKRPFTVFLDPGHGGTDPGAMAGGVREADLNLAVAKKVQTLLQNMGYKVYMSRNDSITTVELLDRSIIANAIAPDIFVSIHTNSTSGGETAANGIESYYYQYIPPYEPKINGDMHNNPERVANSVTLANLIHQKMIQYTGANNRGTAGETFSVLRETATPATLIEMGFINNSSERQRLVTDYYQNLIAQAIADGINAYFR